MQLQINNQSSINSIQKDFNEVYPFLKIEFYKRIPKDQPLQRYMLRPLRQLASIDIGRKKSVQEVEKELERILGLSAHIFRKSGKVWVETTLTNEWPLEEQNEEGKQISSHFEES